MGPYDNLPSFVTTSICPIFSVDSRLYSPSPKCSILRRWLWHSFTSFSSARVSSHRLYLFPLPFDPKIPASFSRSTSNQFSYPYFLRCGLTLCGSFTFSAPFPTGVPLDTFPSLMSTLVGIADRRSLACYVLPYIVFSTTDPVFVCCPLSRTLHLSMSIMNIGIVFFSFSFWLSHFQFYALDILHSFFFVYRTYLSNLSSILAIFFLDARIVGVPVLGRASIVNS